MHIINPIYLGQNYARFFFRAPVVPIIMVGFCPNLLPPPGVPRALALLNAVINPTHVGQKYAHLFVRASVGPIFMVTLAVIPRAPSRHCLVKNRALGGMRQNFIVR